MDTLNALMQSDGRLRTIFKTDEILRKYLVDVLAEHKKWAANYNVALPVGAYPPGLYERTRFIIRTQLYAVMSPHGNVHDNIEHALAESAHFTLGDGIEEVPFKYDLQKLARMVLQVPLSSVGNLKSVPCNLDVIQNIAMVDPIEALNLLRSCDVYLPGLSDFMIFYKESMWLVAHDLKLPGGEPGIEDLFAKQRNMNYLLMGTAPGIQEVNVLEPYHKMIREVIGTPGFTQAFHVLDHDNRVWEIYAGDDNDFYGGSIRTAKTHREMYMGEKWSPSLKLFAYQFTSIDDIIKSHLIALYKEMTISSRLVKKSFTNRFKDLHNETMKFANPDNFPPLRKMKDLIGREHRLAREREGSVMRGVMIGRFHSWMKKFGLEQMLIALIRSTEFLYDRFGAINVAAVTEAAVHELLFTGNVYGDDLARAQADFFSIIQMIFNRNNINVEKDLMEGTHFRKFYDANLRGDTVNDAWQYFTSFSKFAVISFEGNYTTFDVYNPASKLRADKPIPLKNVIKTFLTGETPKVTAHIHSPTTTALMGHIVQPLSLTRPQLPVRPTTDKSPVVPMRSPPLPATTTISMMRSPSPPVELYVDRVRSVSSPLVLSPATTTMMSPVTPTSPQGLTVERTPDIASTFF